MQLIKIKNQALKEIKDSQDLKRIEVIKIKYLGRKGKITALLRSLKDLPEKERRQKGKIINSIKQEIESAIETKKKSQVTSYKLEEEKIDVTAPAKKILVGHLHPITQVRRQIEEIFQSMGFSVVEGPEVETEWYNFDALNIPKDHPARDALSLGKTLYLKGGNLMRSHTSAVQIHYMEQNQPPLRIIVPGNVFRYEATDASHEFQLYQLEGLMVGKGISVANFKAIIGEFFRRFFKKPAPYPPPFSRKGRGGAGEVKFRLRPDFFPFTEPSFDVSISCLVCDGKGCPTCKESGWLEVAGAGMVHPQVFKNSGLNPKDWQGWAFGFGLDRLAMMKYKINDIRLFRSGDLRFLAQF